MLFSVLTLLLALPAGAAWLTYIDDKGTKHVVQSEDDIPEKYRKNVKKSSAGGNAGAIFKPDEPYKPDPGLSVKANCEKEAQYNFEAVRKKLFGRDEGSMSDSSLTLYNELLDRKNKALLGCVTAGKK